jgi:hypothetical protein
LAGKAELDDVGELLAVLGMAICDEAGCEGRILLFNEEAFRRGDPVVFDVLQTRGQCNGTGSQFLEPPGPGGPKRSVRVFLGVDPDEPRGGERLASIRWPVGSEGRTLLNQ